MKKIILFLIIGILLISLAGAVPRGIPIADEHSNNKLCNLNNNICQKVCGGRMIRICTTYVPPSGCKEFCRLEPYPIEI